MTDDGFLEPAWFESMNRRLSSVSLDSQLSAERVCVRVVFDITKSPPSASDVMTFFVDEQGTRLEAVADPAPDLVVSVSYADAAQISSGQMRSSQALRDGRLKVRGDVNALIQFSAWMSEAHRALHPSVE